MTRILKFAKNFFPCAHFCQLIVIAIFLLILASLLIFYQFGLAKIFNQSTPQPTNNQQTTQLSFDQQLNQFLWQDINQWRLNNNLAVYFIDDNLCQFAKDRLNKLNDQQLSHSDFWLLAQDFFPESNFVSLAENLSSYQGKPAKQISANQLSQQILQAWLDSSDHLNNLKADFSHTCVICQHQVCIQVFAGY